MGVPSKRCRRQSDRRKYFNKTTTLSHFYHFVVLLMSLEHCCNSFRGHDQHFHRRVNELLFQQQGEPSNNQINPIYGSINGYDAGGPDAVCWAARFDDTQLSSLLSSPPAHDPSDIILLNHLVTTEVETSEFQQLPSCLEGTNLTIRPIWKYDGVKKDPTMWHGTPLTFDVAVETDLSSYSGAVETSSAVDGILAWVRIFICSESEIGYCHPFLDSSSWDAYFPDPNNVEAQDFASSEGQVLDAFSTDPNENLTFSTSWISQTLTPVRGDDDSISATGSIYRTVVNVTTVVSNDANKGGYHVIGHAILELPGVQRNTTYRVDVSNSVRGPLGIASYPEISYVSLGTKIFIGVLIGVCGLFTMAMTAYIIHHRNHKVMTMAQSGLLTCLSASSFFTIVFSFLLMPTRDIFCELSGLLLIPGTMMPAILVARLWRVYSTLQAALLLGRSDEMERKSSSVTRQRLSRASKASEEWVMRCLTVLSCSKCYERKRGANKQRRTTSLRRAITRNETIGLIISLTLPQTFIQIFGIFYYDTFVWLDLSDDKASCRETCYKADGNWVYYSGAGYMAAMFILAMYVAYISRQLPSAFNEKDEIFRAALFSGLVTVVISVFLAFSDGPTTSPNISTTLTVTMCVTISMVTSFFLVMPKIRRVRSGEPIVISNILREVNGCSASSSEDELRIAANEATKESSTSINPVGIAGSAGILQDSEHNVLHLHSNDAIPKNVEQQLYRLHEIIESVTDRW